MRRVLGGLLAALVLAACGNSGTAPTASAPPAESATASSVSAPAAAPPAAATPATGANSSAAPSAGESLDIRAEEKDKNETALERAVALPAAGSLPAGRWVAGQHYRPLTPTQPTNVAPGKIEVVEVFWYGCSHCYALEPFMQSWLKKLPPDVEFVRVPVMWSSTHRAHARMYYTLQALGKVEALHTQVFDAMHQQKLPLAGGNDADTLKQQQAFATSHGISATDYANAFNSFTVQSKLQLAEELTTRYKVEGVPLVVINGKFVSDVGMAGSQANLISLINDLVAAERRR
jgi:thiol:disulfide interchange protein DsbA